jgi:hypothetical protein
LRCKKKKENVRTATTTKTKKEQRKRISRKWDERVGIGGLVVQTTTLGYRMLGKEH